MNKDLEEFIAITDCLQHGEISSDDAAQAIAAFIRSAVGTVAVRRIETHIDNHLKREWKPGKMHPRYSSAGRTLTITLSTKERAGS
jgi:hypothetical protein